MSDIDIEAVRAAHKKTLGYKAALSAVIILSVLIVLSLAALVAAAVTKFGGKGEAAAPSAHPEFVMPANSQIVSQETQPGRLILHIRTPEGEEIDIIDTNDGKLVSRIRAPKSP